jgi:hypothetical protein
MPGEVMTLKSDKTTTEIEAGPREVQVYAPLRLETWVLADHAAEGSTLAVASADGGIFYGTVTHVNEQRRLVTVELS